MVASPTPTLLLRWDDNLSAKFIVFPTFRARCVRVHGDLLRIDSCRSPVSALLPGNLSQVNIPLQWREWDSSLATHPDQQFRAYNIVTGVREGFRVGFDGRLASNQGDPARNMPSTREMPEVIDDYLAEECSTGRVLGL